MSDLNLQWLNENFNVQHTVLMNIGCADLTDDSLRFAVALPEAQIYSFECSDIWKDQNLEKSQCYNLKYEHKAVSYYDGKARFWNSVQTDSIADSWQYRGRLINPEFNAGLNPALKRDKKDWAEQSTVDVISLNSFCRDNCIYPTFLHIDTEGEEYNILKNLEDQFSPVGIWLENWDQYHDGIDNLVSFDVLDQLLVDRGYQRLYKKNDSLYVKKNYRVSQYIEYFHFDHHAVPISDYEKTIQQKIWIMRYNLIKDPAWPTLSTPKDFFDLPDLIRQECIDIFHLEPDNDII